MKTALVMIAPLILLISGASGCFGNTAPVSADVRVGDAVTYRSTDAGEGSGEITLRVASLFDSEVAGDVTCQAMRLEDVERPDSDHVFCIETGVFGTVSQPYGTIEGVAWEYVSFLPPTGLYGGYIACWLACEALENPLVYDGEANSDQHVRVEYISDGAVGKYTIVWTTWMHRSDTINVVRNSFDISEGPYPPLITVEDVWYNGDGSERLNQSWGYERIGLEIGGGKAIPKFTPGRTGTPPLAEPVAWDRVPEEVVSPFLWSQSAAIDVLVEHPAAVSYFSTRTDAFLALAKYQEYVNPDGQREYLWLFLWKDGRHALGAECHLLETSIADRWVPVAECYEVRPFVTASPQDRTSQPEAILSWDSAAESWARLIGEELPLRRALWTTIDANPAPGQLDTLGEAEELKIPIFQLSSFRGELTTNPDLPSWMASPPDRVYDAPPADTVISALDGSVHTLVRPVPSR